VNQIDKIVDDEIITTKMVGLVNIWFDGKKNHQHMTRG